MADEYQAEPSGGSSGGNNMQELFTPRPSIAFIKAWPKLVELIIRVVCLVLTFCLFVSTCAVLDIFSGGGVHSTAGWLLFVSLMTMIVQGAIIAAKFLNFGFMSTYELVVFAVDVVIAGLTTGALFCGAIAAAVYAADVQDARNLRPDLIPARAVSSSGAVAAFAFFDMFAFIALLVWLIVARFFLSKILGYAKPGAGGGGEESSAPPQDY